VLQSKLNETQRLHYESELKKLELEAHKAQEQQKMESQEKLQLYKQQMENKVDLLNKELQQEKNNTQMLEYSLMQHRKHNMRTELLLQFHNQQFGNQNEPIQDSGIQKSKQEIQLTQQHLIELKQQNDILTLQLQDIGSISPVPSSTNSPISTFGPFHIPHFSTQHNTSIQHRQRRKLPLICSMSDSYIKKYKSRSSSPIYDFNDQTLHIIGDNLTYV
ncbi:MAG: hypothetical protein HRT87_01840, partial [Legionellales bacterium]|nr:hypothetical protein [Legionellales bacterium]